MWSDRQNPRWPPAAGRICALLLAVLGLLAACQPLPHPFQPDHAPPVPGGLLTPGPDAGLTVVPILGAPAETARRLPALVAEQLRQRDIPASSRTTQGDYLVQGAASEHPLAGGNSRIDLDWTLIGPNGLALGTTRHSQTMATAQWQDGDPGALGRLATLAAADIERLARGDAAGRQPLAGTTTSLPRLLIEPVRGAPGDGDAALSRAISAVLGLKGVQLAKPPDPTARRLKGKVTLTDAGAQQQVDIAWVVTDAEGGTLGTVSQRNRVPTGQLDGKWGDVAYAVAMSAADGLMQVLQAPAPAR